jgi:hypothetical protein
VIQPNPARAELLRQLEIPPNMAFWALFRDHQLDAAENGVPQARVAMYAAEVVDKLVDAQLDTIAALINMQKTMLQVGEAAQNIIYKKKEPAPADGATTDQ